MSLTKTFSSILLLTCFAFSANSQCPPPQDPILYIDEVGMFFQVSWFPPSMPECGILYYEVEYNDTPFTPGMGIGTLISPVLSTFLDVPYGTSNAWVRSVCDCEGGPGPGEGDGIPDSESIWVEAIVFTPNNIFPDPSFECGIVDVTVANPVQCGSFPQEMNFIALFSDFPEVVPSCLTAPQYILWTSFVAPNSSAVSITMSTSDWGGGEIWNDFGLIVLESCSGSELFCEASYTESDEVIVSGLVAGEEYVIGNWNNGYPYEWFADDLGGIIYNGTTNVINVCETTVEIDDWSLTPGPLVTIECSELPPQPDYTLGDSWGPDAVVTYDLQFNSLCGDTSTYLINVSDDMGHFASGEQQIIIQDSTAPEIILADEITISCGETPTPQYDIVDICTGFDVIVEESIVLDCLDAYDVLYTITAVDECGNENSATQIVSVVDTIAPVFGNCPDSIYFNSDMTAIDMIDLSESSDFDISDNCAEEFAFTQSIASGTSLEAGLYPIELTITDNCDNTSICQSVVVVTTTVGLNEIQVEALNIYPNPSHNEFNVTIDFSSSIRFVQIYDLYGRLVIRHDIEPSNESIVSIPIQELRSGSYVVELSDFKGNVIGRSTLLKE